MECGWGKQAKGFTRALVVLYHTLGDRVGSCGGGGETRNCLTKRIPWVDSSVHLPPLHILEGRFVISVPTKNVQYHT